MVPIHPVVLEKKFVLHISHRVAMLNYVPRWWPSKIFFSDTTWRMELKIVMNDHCKLLTKCCYSLDRLKIQDAKEISIFGNSSHFEWRAALSDTILKRAHPTTIPAKFTLTG
jgi:hypothetical protein